MKGERTDRQYTVVKGTIPAERAAEYVQRMYGWLESFNLGFKGNDPSTWHIDRVPYFNRYVTSPVFKTKLIVSGGIYTRNGAGHEQFAWDIRGEPGVINAFAKIWGTDELLVSFGESCYGTMLIADAVNISLPYPKEEMEGQRGRPWPHVDQSPNKRFKNCIQGIANLVRLSAHHESVPADSSGEERTRRRRVDGPLRLAPPLRGVLQGQRGVRRCARVELARCSLVQRR